MIFTETLLYNTRLEIYVAKGELCLHAVFFVLILLHYHMLSAMGTRLKNTCQQPLTVTPY